MPLENSARADAARADEAASSSLTSSVCGTGDAAPLRSSGVAAGVAIVNVPSSSSPSGSLASAASSSSSRSTLEEPTSPLASLMSRHTWRESAASLRTSAATSRPCRLRTAVPAAAPTTGWAYDTPCSSTSHTGHTCRHSTVARSIVVACCSAGTSPGASTNSAGYGRSCCTAKIRASATSPSNALGSSSLAVASARSGRMASLKRIVRTGSAAAPVAGKSSRPACASRLGAESVLKRSQRSWSDPSTSAVMALRSGVKHRSAGAHSEHSSISSCRIPAYSRMHAVTSAEMRASRSCAATDGSRAKTPASSPLRAVPGRTRTTMRPPRPWCERTNSRSAVAGPRGLASTAALRHIRRLSARNTCSRQSRRETSSGGSTSMLNVRARPPSSAGAASSQAACAAAAVVSGRAAGKTRSESASPKHRSNFCRSSTSSPWKCA
eukprot:Unigene6320_Nuclearia_a/m.19462 Unigene6320_Nuclearia_a/g.19462  ORF Unigene6320_Nuclearia_a/g.19462 Unigene6320_Nuclearia_a/m.19462 type:complete len:439 (+) Unigene6320_Nuclearia_a:488-1804(+)